MVVTDLDLARVDRETVTEFRTNLSEIDDDTQIEELPIELERLGLINWLATASKAVRLRCLREIEMRFQLDFNIKRAIEATVIERMELLRKEKPDLLANNKRFARYVHYHTFFEKHFGTPKKDLLTRDVYYWDDIDKEYIPCENFLNVLKAEAYDDEFYAPTKLDSMFAKYSKELPAELITKIPVWDKVDRIEQIVSALTITNLDPVTSYDLICDWGAKMIRRIYEPWTRNRVLIFQGPQNIGKDWLIDALVDGIEEPGLSYVRNIRVDEHGELEQKLHAGIVFKIGEFDRTSKVAVSQLKHIVTVEATNERLKYDRKAQNRKVRCSFIASANPSDLLRDTTGNTRFIVISLEKINFDYPGARSRANFAEERKQIIAQFKHLADNGFKSSQESEAHLADYLSLTAPDDPMEDFLEYFDKQVSALCDREIINLREVKEARFIENKDLDPVYEDIKKQFSLSRTEVQRRLSAAGRRKRSAKSRGYRFKYIGNIGEHHDD